MNAKIESLEFNVNRLRVLMNLWENPSDTASPLFIAMNIADFTERVYRHKTWAEKLRVVFPEESETILQTAQNLIANDARIPDLVFTHISFDLFHLTLNNFIESYENAQMDDYEIDFETADLVDHYFSTERVLRSMERLVRNPPINRVSDIAAFRDAFLRAVNDNFDLAEAARDASETAPGGPDMPPWPELLEHAPDHLFDTIQSADYVERMQRDTQRGKEINYENK